MRGTIAGLALVASLVAVAPASAAKAPTRFSLAGGCYALETASGEPVAGAEKLRMQATGLGTYLLYTPDQTVLAAQGDGSVTPDEAASPAADWRVGDTGGGAFSLSPLSDPTLVLAVAPDGSLRAVAAGGAGNSSRFSFAKAKGCAVYPEAELGATGTPSKGKTDYGEVGGFLEGHMHWMTYEYLGGRFHCGQPWHRYGIPYALPDCSEIEGPQGTAAPVQNFLNYGNPGEPHDTTGWPKLTEWNAHNLTYEGTYYRWIERAWMSGLRTMVMSVNENRVLCELQANRTSNCDEMDTVRRGFKDIHELEDYVDAQAGGPGKGFFEIVTNPYQARRVINQGRMAVVLEIEVSELYGCRGLETNSTCDREQVDRELKEFHKLGVRSSLLLNKVDNPLTGVRFDSGEVGVLINAANRQSSGSFWSAETCTGPYHDNEIETFSPEGSATFNALLAAVGTTPGEVPTYPPAPHCNTRGLTQLGSYLEKQMIKRHMIINPDHMSQKAVDETLSLAEANDYSGVISPHGWMDPGNWPRLWKLGGLAFPDSSTAPEYVDAYRKYRPKRTPFDLGWGYGADLGGLAAQPDAAGAVDYPFKSYDGKVNFKRQTTGERTFDYNTEGVAHYGLYPEWFEDLQTTGGGKLARDMWEGSEAYLEMWERADGIRTPGCKPTSGHVNAGGLGKLRLGDRWEGLLRHAGQPQHRDRAWSWCVRGDHNAHAADVAELSKGGRVELVASTAKGRAADGIAVGADASRLRNAEGVGGGVFVSSGGGPAYVFSVRKGRVDAVGVATGALAGSDSKLRGAMRRARKAKATQAKPRFVPNPAEGSTRLTGTNLAGSSDPRLNEALVALCSLQGG
jgi:hypothetical protein